MPLFTVEALFPTDFEIGTVDYIDRMERLYPVFTRVFLLHKTTNVTTRYLADCGAY